MILAFDTSSLEGFDYATMAEIRKAIVSSNLFQYTIVGTQAVSIAFVLMKLIHQFVKGAFKETPDGSPLRGFLGTVVLISLAPSALDIITNIFSSVDGIMDNYTFNRLPTSIKSEVANFIAEKEATGTYQKLLSLPSELPYILVLGMLVSFSVLIWAIDNAIFSVFVMEQMFLVELFKFLFPITLAFVGLEALRNTYFKWIKMFIGIMLLPIPYIAVFRFIELVNDTMESKNNFDGIKGLLYSFIIIVISLGIKYKLLRTISQKVLQLLS